MITFILYVELKKVAFLRSCYDNFIKRGNTCQNKVMLHYFPFIDIRFSLDDYSSVCIYYSCYTPEGSYYIMLLIACPSVCSYVRNFAFALYLFNRLKEMEITRNTEAMCRAQVSACWHQCNTEVNLI